ncbi:MAG: hypothetical protein JSV97_13215 [candidate division WOR-3 bacterium]|nr:MAG: hypothetical protein JSV97_13215 [candidate division WOR-3 bacterium]
MISTRVGETIDREEREYFDLFLEIANFEAAAFYEIEGGGYEVEIITEYEKLIAVNRDPNSLNILRDYIDRFEEIVVTKKYFEKKWRIKDYDDLGLPITIEEINRTMRYSFIVGCGVGGCLIGLLSSASVVLFRGFLAAMSDHFESEGDEWLIITAATGVGLITGSLAGYAVAKEKALTAIKKARKLRSVEQ